VNSSVITKPVGIKPPTDQLQAILDTHSYGQQVAVPRLPV
jgi:hypothetical protein